MSKVIPTLKESWQLELEASSPYNFELTVHKPRYGYWLTPFEVYCNGIIWSGLRLSDNTSVGLRAGSIGTLQRPRVKVHVFCDQKLTIEQERELTRMVSACLSSEEDISEFYVLANHFPALKQAKNDLYGMRDTPFPDLFNGIILAVTLQMTTWQRSIEMMKSLYEVYGEKIEFDGKRIVLCPAPEVIAKVNEDELKRKCRVGYRAGSLRAIAEVLTGTDFPSLQELARLPPTEAKQQLMKLKGVGEYSADIVTPHPSFPVDIWSAKVFSSLFGIEAGGKPREIIPIIKEFARNKFGKWQSYVYAYILHDLQKISETFSLSL